VGPSTGLHIWENSKKDWPCRDWKTGLPARNRVPVPTGISRLSFNDRVLRIEIESMADEEAQQLEGDGAQNCHRDLTIANKDYDLC